MGNWKRFLSLAITAGITISAVFVPQNAYGAAKETKVTDDQLSDTKAEEPDAWGALPNEEQLHYMKTGLSAFCHFGPNTYNNVEWGESYGTREPADIFKLKAPQKFDAERIVKTVKEAGFNRMILTAKHHDGFGLWDSALTDYDIGRTPYGGDILEELSDACTKYNLDMGCYLSPWDIHEDHYGCFGDNNNGPNSTGYTDYDKLYQDEIKEICTAVKKDANGNELKDENGNPVYKYGNNHPNRRSDRFVEWWMDGAQGGGSNTQTFTWPGIFEAIRGTNPNCQIFGTHKAGKPEVNGETVKLGSTGGIHWIGNEAGWAADETWAKLIAGENYEDTSLFPRENGGIIGKPDGDCWSVPEVDVRMLSGWFWTENNPDSSVKSAKQLGNIYFNSVGHGAVLLLNLSPNKTGSVGELQLNRFKQFGENIKNTFRDDLTKEDGVTISATSVWKNSKAFSPNNVLDEIPEGETYDTTYWAPAEGETTGSLEIDLGGHKVFDVVSIEEYIQKGQTISSFSVEYKDVNGDWQAFGSGKTISSKRLCRRTPVEGTAVRINILSAHSTPMINDVGVFKAVEDFEMEAEGKEKLPENLKTITMKDAVKTGEWTSENNGAYQYTDQQNNSAQFTFTGVKAWVLGRKALNHGRVDIYLDNELQETVDTNASSAQLRQILYQTNELPYGEHTIRLVCKDTGKIVGLDRVEYTDGSGIFSMHPAETNLLYGETADVEIVRTLGSRGRVEITYTTESAGAEQGVNYKHLAGSVLFEEGETSKTITLTGLVSIDRNVDGKDFYFVIRSDSGDAAIGPVSSTHAICYTVDPERILNECRAVNPDDYKDAGKEAFQKALRELELFMESGIATENAKKAAASAAYRAKQALVRWDGNYSQNEPYKLPSGYQETKTVEAERFILDASEAKNPNHYVRISENGSIQEVNWFEDGNKIKLPFYAEKAGTYKVTAHYRSGRSANSPNALNWSGTNVESGSLDVHGEGQADTYRTAEFTMRITAAGAGELVFTADSKGSPVLDKFDVLYQDAAAPSGSAVTGVALNYEELTIGIDEECALLTAEVFPADAGNKQVTFTSADTEIAAVDEYGIVKGIKDGTTTVTVATEDGNKTAECIVHVVIEQEALQYTEGKEELSVIVSDNTYTEAVQDESKPYSAAMKQNFEEAYRAASTAVGRDDTKLKELIACTEALKKARNGLDLEEAVAEAAAFANAGGYTESSMRAFMQKYNTAVSAVSEAGYAQETAQSLKAILAELKEMQKKLEKLVTIQTLQTPAGVKAVSKATGEVVVTFQKVTNATSYDIYRQSVKIASVTGTSYTDAKAPGGKTSIYTVIAVSSDPNYKNSAASSGASVRMLNTVKKLKIKAVKGGAKITFQKVKGAKKYLVYRASKEDGPYKKVKTLKAKQTSFTDKKAKKGKNFYRVVVQSGKSYSPAAAKKVTVKKK